MTWRARPRMLTLIILTGLLLLFGAYDRMLSEAPAPRDATDRGARSAPPSSDRKGSRRLPSLLLKTLLPAAR